MVPSWKTGYVILVCNPWEAARPVSYFWRGIQLVSNTIYNHCAIALVENGQLYIVEALGKGVGKFSYQEWYERDRKRRIRVIPHESPAEDILQYVGRPYDQLGLFSCLWRKITNHYWGAPAAKASNRVYCYELLALIKKHPTPHQIMPAEFIKYMNQLSFF